MQSLRLGRRFGEFALHEFVVIEVLFRQAEIGGGGLLSILRPTRVFIYTTSRTSLGIARYVCAAVGANLGRHTHIYDFRFQIYDLL